MKEHTGIKDWNGNFILEGDVLSDKVPSNGIVVYSEGKYLVTSDFQGRNIMQLGHSDLLNERLVNDNEMVVIGNIHDDPSIVLKKKVMMTRGKMKDILNYVFEHYMDASITDGEREEVATALTKIKELISR
jgi:hypothetical protein